MGNGIEPFDSLLGSGTLGFGSAYSTGNCTACLFGLYRSGAAGAAQYLGTSL